MTETEQRNIEVEVVADSVNPQGQRIVSYLLTYPRMIHSEIMTHRALSRNAASSRAIPVNKVIDTIQESPAVPEWWGKTQKGMSAREQFEPGSAGWGTLMAEWEFMRDLTIGGDEYTAVPSDVWDRLTLRSGNHQPSLSEAEWEEVSGLARRISGVKGLLSLGLHKQIANRPLEPWFRITVLVTATCWDNFFALRAHKDAQPEFQVLAYRMLNQFVHHKPKELDWGEWHMPFDIGADHPVKDRLVVSTAKAARTSYVAFDSDKTLGEQYELYNAMSGMGHWSPFEHQAQAEEAAQFSGNFRGGWLQHRALFPGENRKVTDYKALLREKPDWITL